MWATVATESVSRHTTRSHHHIDIGWCVAQFIRFYGAQTFDGGNIGWKMFWLLYGHMKRLRAVERVELTQAVSIGTGLVMGGENVERLAQRDITEAYD